MEAEKTTMKITIVRIVITLSLFALIMGAGFTGAVAAQENAASECGQERGVVAGSPYDTGAEFGDNVSDFVRDDGTPPGTLGAIISTVCSP